MTCDQQFCTFTYVLQSRAPGGIGKRGTCPALGIYTRLIQLQHFVSDKKYQNRYHKTRSWFKIYANCSHRPRAVLKRFAPQQRREGRVERAGGKGRGGKGGEEWRDRGRNRVQIDFAPSCKNSCGRPWLQQDTVLYISWLVTKLRCTSLTVNQHLPLNARVTVAHKVLNWLISTSPYVTLLTSENFLIENSTRSCVNTHKLSMYTSKRYTKYTENAEKIEWKMKSVE